MQNSLVKIDLVDHLIKHLVMKIQDLKQQIV